jgi:SAM-dependent methyltransferase
MTGHRRRLEMLQSWASHDANVYRAFMKTISDLGCVPDRTSVLDIGCGANAPVTIMLHSAGVKVTGIDGYIGYRWGLGFKPGRYWRYLQEAGIRKTARKIIGECVYDRHYYIALAQAIGCSLTEKGLDLRQMNAENLQFEDSSFDVVYSNAAWEHFADVRQVNHEVARVLRKGGIAYIEIHLFPSLSGGHDLPWIVPGKTDLGGIRPWRHLRDLSWEAPVYLNRLREKDYCRFFEETQRFEVVEWKTEFTEGEEFITEELLHELSDYTRQELTKRSVIVVLRKKN